MTEARTSSKPPSRAAAAFRILGAGLGMVLATPASAEVPLNLKAESSDNPLIRLDPHLGKEISQSIGDDLDSSKHLREVFQVRLDRGQAAQFDATSEKIDAQLQLYSETGELLVENDDGGGDTNARLHFANLQGKSNRFYVVVSTVGERAGPFNLTISRRPTPQTGIPTPISDGLTLAGSVSPDSPLRISDQMVFKSYYFEGAAGDRVHISAKPEGAPVKIELSQNGNKLGTGNPSRRDGSASLFETLKNGGRHDVAILGDPTGTSSFEVKLQKLPPPKASAEPSLMRIGQAAEGAFLEDSPVLPGTNNRPYSLFRVEGRQGQQILLSAALVKTGSEAVDSRPLTVDIGIDTPVGFAAARQTYPPHGSGARRGLVTFERDGTVLIRVAAPTGTFGRFTLNVEPAPATAGSKQ